ncbi:MAG: hypothetical protein [Siphoviridae sp. ct7UA22]|nr:MAG: hypothetical protein [Siphoviridae sp. ct7UA22]
MSISDFDMAVDNFIFLSRYGIDRIYVSKELYSNLQKSRKWDFHDKGTLPGAITPQYRQYPLYVVDDLSHEPFRIISKCSTF